MRKISDLFSRGDSASAIEREDLEGGVAAMIDYRIKGEGIDQMELIAEFYELINFPSSMKDGNLAHVSGIAGDEIIFTSIWDNESNAQSAYAELGPAIEEVIGRQGPNVTVERHSSGVWALLRRHGQDLSTNELDPVVLRQNACLGHPLIFRPCPAPRLHCTHVTVPAHRTALNRREASSPMRSTHGMCRSILRGMKAGNAGTQFTPTWSVRDIRISAPLNR